jgi:hypothetical protein
MSLVLADIGADAILAAYFNNSFPAANKHLTLKLFATNVAPADTSASASFTEAAGGGYASITLSSGSWTVAAANDPSDAVYAEQTFTFTGALTTNGTIYGYYVVNAENTLIWAEALSATFTPANNGDTLKITPKFQLSKGTPS